MHSRNIKHCIALLRAVQQTNGKGTEQFELAGRAIDQLKALDRNPSAGRAEVLHCVKEVVVVLLAFRR